MNDAAKPTGETITLNVHGAIGEIAPEAWDICAGGINPTPKNYANMALTPAGLEVGIGQGQTAAEACGSRHVLVPWNVVRSSLTRLGAELMGAALAPTH